MILSILKKVSHSGMGWDGGGGVSKIEYGNFLKNYVPNNLSILLAEKIEKFLFTLLCLRFLIFF